MKNKNFDYVEMTRSIRNEFYEKNKDLSFNDFVTKLVDEAHKSTLWKKVKKVSVKK
ncbi:MAG: hypothetical protein JXB88_24945 [Spirochaetales bacterium]|nr:hypothetical protein [Spirochaetales bacterium]